ncbi:AAA family ATPase [Actinoallomurus sp. NPDC050550]|uniref:helix-turn-helix transcriptional regulator n=1 Tax=Actinoallomurus sp. NPDC050550 TaxID=3154937 RepID=UPI00340523EC
MARTVLRGRSEAMATALSMLRRVRTQGHGGVLVVEGEPGIGKSAVFAAIADQAMSMEFGCGVSKADQIGRISPAAPLLLALRSGSRPLLTAAELADLAARTAEPLLLLDDVAGLLERLSNERPLLIGIDDAQWSDPVSRFVLRSLPSRLTGSPILWLFASRSSDEGLLDDLKRSSFVESRVEVIELGPLSAPDIMAMAEDRLHRVPSARVSRMLDGVGGNPFFATQIMEGVVREKADDDADLDIPTEFILGVRRRVAELDQATAELMRVAAVFGQALTVEDAAALLPEHSTEQVTHGLAEAVRTGLLENDRAPGLTFRHDLIREAIYADLTERTRRTLHQRCAQHLRDAGADPLTIATHARAGISPGDEHTAALLADAADQAAGAMPEAASELILAAFHSVRPEQDSWLTLGRRCVELLSLVQRCTEAMGVADVLLAHLDDDEPAGHVEIAVARALWLTGQWQDSVVRSTRALSRPNVSPALRAQLAALQALALSRVEPAATVGPVAEDALREADRLDDDGARHLAWHALAEVARNRADHDGSLRHFRALRAASGPAYIAQEIQGLQHLDRFHDADVMLQNARRDMSGDRGRIFMSLIYSQIWRDYNLARFDDAEAGAQTLLELALERGSYTCGIEAPSLLSMVALQRGDVAEARRKLASGFGPASAEDERRMPLPLLIRGWVTAAEGHVDEAVSLLSPVVFTGREERDPWPWKPGWLRMLAQLGMTAGADEFTEEVVALAETGAQRNPEVPSLTGTALQLRGTTRKDLELLQRAADVLALSPRPLLTAGGYEDLGFELLDRDRRQEGATLLDQAWDIYDGVGATGPMKTLQDRARKAGLRRAHWRMIEPRPASGSQSLTPSELKVARLIVSGYTNKAASEELGISVNTVGTHLRSVFAKLGVRSRVQLSNVMHEQDTSMRV